MLIYNFLTFCCCCQYYPAKYVQEMTLEQKNIYIHGFIGIFFPHIYFAI